MSLYLTTSMIGNGSTDDRNQLNNEAGSGGSAAGRTLAIPYTANNYKIGSAVTCVLKA